MGRGSKADLAVDLGLLVLALLLDHEDRVVEKVHGELGALALSPSALLKWALVNHLALLVPESQVLFIAATRVWSVSGSE